MKILVTGGAGFIGSHLVDALLGRGERVAVIDNFNDYYDPALKRENVEAHIANPLFTLHESDIRDRARVTEIIGAEAPDVICHLAARAGVRPSIEDPILYEETNCRATLNLLEAVKDRGIKNFVFASSSSVYGINSKIPFSEEDPITSTISPYAATKRAGELYGYAYSHLYKMPVTCLRFFTVYGERGRPDMAVAKFTRLIQDGRPIQVYGDGHARRDFTYIGDIIAGLVNAVYTPHSFEIINLGGSQTIEVNGLISLIETNLGRKAEVIYGDPAPGDVPVTYADVTKAGRLIGFAPKVNLSAGVARYVKWFLEREARKGRGAAE
ncbi:MAG: epimerase [Deltaproteobacteria bacterium RIFCSPLOWO2_02_FULL_53_8]|nr:MAG: epimerase [Deltaproteobacteria bacterium RIFCSPLOWO2_02_FULL_53_8]